MIDTFSGFTAKDVRHETAHRDRRRRDLANFSYGSAAVLRHSLLRLGYRNFRIIANDCATVDWQDIGPHRRTALRRGPVPTHPRHPRGRVAPAAPPWRDRDRRLHRAPLGRRQSGSLHPVHRGPSSAVRANRGQGRWHKARFFIRRSCPVDRTRPDDGSVTGTPPRRRFPIPFIVPPPLPQEKPHVLQRPPDHPAQGRAHHLPDHLRLHRRTPHPECAQRARERAHQTTGRNLP